MEATTFGLERPEGVVLFVYRWLPDGPAKAQLYLGILSALPDVARPSRQARIPKKLPIYIFGGTRDAVGSNIGQLLEAYRAAGLENVQHRLYPNGRHESLNEINRDEVTGDLVRWLNSIVAHDATSSSTTSVVP